MVKKRSTREGEGSLSITDHFNISIFPSLFHRTSAYLGNSYVFMSNVSNK